MDIYKEGLLGRAPAWTNNILLLQDGQLLEEGVITMPPALRQIGEHGLVCHIIKLLQLQIRLHNCADQAEQLPEPNSFQMFMHADATAHSIL